MTWCRLAAGIFVVTFLGSSLYGGAYSELIIFGDSWTDAGNVYHDTGNVAPLPPSFEGRFSDGPVWPAYLADQLGITRPTASQTGGTNFAYGSAKTGSGSVSPSWIIDLGLDPINVPNIGAQIDRYLAAEPTIDSTKLYAIFGGFNDFDNANTSPQSVVDNIVEHVNQLHDAGASNFLLFTLEFEDFDSNFNNFNRLLKPMVESLKESVDDANFFLVDFKELTGPVLESFGDYAISSQFGSATNEDREIVSNPDHAFWWDPGFHPTVRYHRILGERITEILVPDLNTHYVAGWRNVGEELHGNPLNFAIGGNASQSSTHNDHPGLVASVAIDGEIDRKQTRNSIDDPAPWWQVELSEPRDATELKVYSRSSSTLTQEGGFRVELFGDEDEPIWQQDVVGERYDYPFDIEIDAVATTKRIRLSKLEPISDRFGSFTLEEVQVFGTERTPSDLVLSEGDIMHFEIDGGLADHFASEGALNLSGSVLAVELLNGSLGFGDTFELFDVAQVVGEFGHINLPLLDKGLAWDVSRVNSEGVIAVVPEPTTVMMLLVSFFCWSFGRHVATCHDELRIRSRNIITKNGIIKA